MHYLYVVAALVLMLIAGVVIGTFMHDDFADEDLRQDLRDVARTDGWDLDAFEEPWPRRVGPRHGRHDAH